MLVELPGRQLGELAARHQVGADVQAQVALRHVAVGPLAVVIAARELEQPLNVLGHQKAQDRAFGQVDALVDKAVQRVPVAQEGRPSWRTGYALSSS